LLSNQQEGISTQDLGKPFPTQLVLKNRSYQAFRATSLTDVNYAASTEGTVVILTGNGNFEGVENTSLENPNRIVVDLKDIKKNTKDLPKLN
jgi:hypothetical protein